MSDLGIPIADWEREYLASPEYARSCEESAARQRAIFAEFRRRRAIRTAWLTVILAAAFAAGYRAGRA